LAVSPYGEDDTVPTGFIRAKLSEPIGRILKTPVAVEDFCYVPGEDTGGKGG
jgi:hypothetical protein